MTRLLQGRSEEAMAIAGARNRTTSSATSP